MRGRPDFPDAIIDHRKKAPVTLLLPRWLLKYNRDQQIEISTKMIQMIRYVEKHPDWRKKEKK